MIRYLNLAEAASADPTFLVRRISLTILIAVLISILVTTKAQALVEIDLNDAGSEPLPIAITEFTGADIASDIVDVVTADLYNSGLFRPLDPASYIDKGRGPDAIPRFEDWRLINAQALVMGRVSQTADGRLQTEFRLWDVFGGEQLVGQQFVTTQQNWRRVAHIIADAIYEKLTGEKGYFNTRIVYIDESGPKDARVKKLAIMDQDGANARVLTRGNSLVLTPRFSPTRQEITYMSYEGGTPRVFLLQIETGQRELVSDSRRMSFSPRFSTDGQKIIMSLELDEGGNSNIFTMDLRSRAFTRLTNTAAIDTAPSYSPDGQQVVFESDRGGRQQLYVMNANGSDQKRISFGPGSYATPVWSPRGDTIAFTKFHQGKFAIGVMKPDGTGERILTESFHNEGPTWAPNGRVLMFFRDEGNGPKLFSIDLTGYNERQIATPNFGSDPAWSPLLD